MSSINDTRLDRANLDPLAAQARLDALQGREQELQARDLQGAERVAPAYAPPATDPGEDVLNASAWNGVPHGQRQLPGDLALERSLGAMDLSQAADRGADAVLDAIG